MATNYTLKYRTFEELIDSCSIDMKKYQDKGFIDPMELIKIARKCNAELGLRIYQTKERVIEVTHGKAKLPDDFYVINFALGLGNGKVKRYLPQGTHIEEKVVAGPLYQIAPPEEINLCKDREDICREEEPVPVDDCEPHQVYNQFEYLKVPGSCFLDCQGNTVQLIQRLQYNIMTYSEFFPINIISDTEDFNGFCNGKYWQAKHTATIKNGWIYTSFQNGKIYINYQGDMIDDEGNLLVPDHEILNEFYEYAIKQRVIENLILNDEEINANKIQIIEQRYRAARNNAMSFVNTPNFNELREMMKMNRRAMFNKYYSAFSSLPNF